MRKNSSIFSITGALILTGIIAGCGDDAAVEEPEVPTEEETDAVVEGEDPAPDYPTDTITFIVPFSAGGSGDVMTREIAQIAEEFFGVPTVVENNAGGSGSIALNEVLNEEADGYTILNHSSTLPLTMASGQIPFTPENIEPIATMVSNYQVLAVPADSPIQTFEDFVAAAEENPGGLDVASSQTYGTNHIFALKIMDGAGIDFNYVGYDGGSEALARILGGNADAIASSGEVVQQQVESGELRILAVSSSERIPEHPDVPTFKELGMDRIDDELIWRGFFVRPGTPEPIQQEITNVLEAVSETPEFAEYAERTNQDIYFRAGDELDTIFENYYADGVEFFEGI